MKRLAEAGVPVGVLVAPVIPFLTDHQIEPVLEAAWENGARQAGYTLMRLPWEVKDLFKDWLERHYPLKAKHVMSRVHAMRGGRDNDPELRQPHDGRGRAGEAARAALRQGLRAPRLQRRAHAARSARSTRRSSSHRRRRGRWISSGDGP